MKAKYTRDAGQSSSLVLGALPTKLFTSHDGTAARAALVHGIGGNALGALIEKPLERGSSLLVGKTHGKAPLKKLRTKAQQKTGERPGRERPGEVLVRTIVVQTSIIP